MTHLSTETSPERYAGGRPATAGSDPNTTPAGSGPAVDDTRAVRRAGVVAGAALLVLSALGGFGNLVVVEGLVTPGDAAATAVDIAASEGMFRLGIASLYLVVVLDVVVAWALLRFLSPVNRDLSRLAAWFRLAYGAVFLVAVAQLAGVPRLLQDDDPSGAFTTGQRQAQAMTRIDAFSDIWFAGLILFGIHLVLLGVLVHRSGYVPRLLGVLLVVAGAGYVFDSAGRVFSDDAPVVTTVTFVGEFLLALWLVLRAGRVSPERDMRSDAGGATTPGSTEP